MSFIPFVSGFCSACKKDLGRTKCFVAECRNYVGSKESSKEPCVAVGGKDDAKQQMESLNHFVKAHSSQ